MTWVPQQLEGAYVGQEDLTMECHTEAFPNSINYWTNPNGDMVVTGERFESVLAQSSYKVYMRLRISAVGREDFGTFRCVAKNSLEIEPPQSPRGPEDMNRSTHIQHQGHGSQVTVTPANEGKQAQAKLERRKYYHYWKPKGRNEFAELDNNSKTKGYNTHDWMTRLTEGNQTTTTSTHHHHHHHHHQQQQHHSPVHGGGASRHTLMAPNVMLTKLPQVLLQLLPAAYICFFCP
ncbi:hypothetical protein Pmani_029381 [Petrolisthes manimaculis]|uniref:Ig-like domain-containing protein n=1 Tax=Petrolisthes manimaculis TaxID=1843537 RepID=A0AAE1NZG5_9EUCA|nr:hypothetical protein Pmani_029381 [Petrolisthes manimaculis]